jgi:hypothetical protein
LINRLHMCKLTCRLNVYGDISPPHVQVDMSPECVS